MKKKMKKKNWKYFHILPAFTNIIIKRIKILDKKCIIFPINLEEDNSLMIRKFLIGWETFKPYASYLMVKRHVDTAIFQVIFIFCRKQILVFVTVFLANDVFVLVSDRQQIFLTWCVYHRWEIKVCYFLLVFLNFLNLNIRISWDRTRGQVGISGAPGGVKW